MVLDTLTRPKLEWSSAVLPGHQLRRLKKSFAINVSTPTHQNNMQSGCL